MDKNATSIPKTLVSGLWDVKKQDLFADIWNPETIGQGPR